MLLYKSVIDINHSSYRSINVAFHTPNHTPQTTVEEALCFPYYRDGKIVNIKYRAMPKLFWQVRPHCCHSSRLFLLFSNLPSFAPFSLPLCTIPTLKIFRIIHLYNA